MIEAVENHMPEVIVIDEIGTELEAQAARTIAERGVQLIATAHGNTLENLMLNPTLPDLIGGIQTVTLGDEEARRRGTQKSVLERKAPPTFDVVVEIQNWNRVAVHEDVAGGRVTRSCAATPVGDLAVPGRSAVRSRSNGRRDVRRARRASFAPGRAAEEADRADAVLARDVSGTAEFRRAAVRLGSRGAAAPGGGSPESTPTG